MSNQTAAADEVLPFGKSDVVNGVGELHRIVDLSGYTERRDVTEEGRCHYCGYDRADWVSHTEIEQIKLVCRNCDHVFETWD